MCNGVGNNNNPQQPENHGFDWNQINAQEESLTEGLIRNRFSTLCDALQFNGNAKIGTSAIEKDGYYREGFYMLHPFYYIGEGFGINSGVKNGIVFIAISAGDDIDNLSIKKILPKVKSEAIEQMPVVVFRNYIGPICIPGTTVDLSEDFHCHKDTYEFLGVYKAEKAVDDGYYKLAKVFDRYYFNTNTIISD